MFALIQRLKVSDAVAPAACGAGPEAARSTAGATKSSQSIGRAAEPLSGCGCVEHGGGIVHEGVPAS